MTSPEIGPALDPELEHVLSMIRHHARSHKIPADSIRLIFEAGMAASGLYRPDLVGDQTGPKAA